MAILFYTITLTCTFSLVFSIWIYILMTLYGADAITVRAVDAIAISTHSFTYDFCLITVVVVSMLLFLLKVCLLLLIPFVFTYC